ncbi:hypothetical protein [Phaeovulum sp.]|uniref:hypothetical protein n=1 Tax=Phaeovulum sp. TaxID=2934796 RepID=UPI0039E6D567
MTQRTIDELLFHWRTVIGKAPPGWARNFALSIQKARRRPDWHPSSKQLSLMQQMVAELFIHGADDGEIDVIERG